MLCLVVTSDKTYAGFHLTVLWLFRFSLIAVDTVGGQITACVGVGPLEISVGFGLSK